MCSSLSKGYKLERRLYNPHRPYYDGDFKQLIRTMSKLTGVKGYFSAIVFSPKHFDGNELAEKGHTGIHAVVIDNEFNIIHDPNPNYQNIESYPMSTYLGLNGVLAVDVINPMK